MVGSASVPNAPVQLYLTPDGNEVVSADQGTKDAQGHTLSVIDTKAMTTRGTVTTGAGPHGVVIDDSGEWAWVTNSFDNTVTAVDLVVDGDAPDSRRHRAQRHQLLVTTARHRPGQQHHPRHPQPVDLAAG